MESNDKDLPHLYDITGFVLDINTLLVNRNEYRKLFEIITRLEQQVKLNEARMNVISGDPLQIHYHTFKGGKLRYSVGPSFSNYERDFYPTLTEAIDATISNSTEND